MQIKPLDLTRKLLIWLSNAKQEPEEYVQRALPKLRRAVKFQLPENGLVDKSKVKRDAESGHDVFDPMTLKALMAQDELRLPYPLIALEFEAQEEDGSMHRQIIILAEEHEATVSITPFDYRQGMWFGLEPHHIGKSELRADRIPQKYQPLVVQVLAFLNAIACTNVQVREQRPSAVKVAMRKTIPYDSVKFLTISVEEREERGPKGSGGGTTGWHPREHIRRGSWCRHPKGTLYWRNSCTVNEGKGYARVDKIYKVGS